MQAFVCLALALLLFSFARRDPLPQLRWWTWSWVALLVYLGTAAFAISVISQWHWPAGDWRRILISAASLAAGLMQPCFVAMGAFESVRERPIASGTRRTLLAVVVIAAIALTFATLSLPATNTLRLSARYVVAGVVFVAAAVLLMRSGARAGSRGPIVLAWSALAYGLGQFHGLAWLVRREVAGTIEVFPFYLGFGDVLLQMFLGLGMLMWHLEAQRERAQRALVDLERSQEALRHTQRMESVGRLAGGVAHDFNNLMTIMVAAGEELEDHHPARSPGHEAIQHLKDAVHRAKSLTSQLLAFSRNQVTQPERVDLVELVALQERMLTRLLGTEVVLERETTAVRLPVMADPSQFTQVLMNLVVNARDAMRDGGVMSIATGEAVLGTTDGERLQVAPGRYATVAVRDNGTGMTEEVRARVFEPFFTTKPRGVGTGLGLAVVRQATVAARGRVSVESAIGRG
ncbi:MAG: sensor histidine kinase, partial [bacterium]